MVAVTGDDNSGDPAPTDSTEANGTVPAGDQAALQSVAAESNGDMAERDEVGAVEFVSGAEPVADAAPVPDAEPVAGAEPVADAEPVAASGSATDADGDEAASADLEQESEIAADYIEGLLDVADLDGDIDMDVEGDRPMVSVVGATLTELVGPRGEVLEALQELTRLAVHRQTGVRSRIMLDVGGYRARRRQELAELGRRAAEQVSRTGVPQRLDAMTPFERKVVHDAVAAAGLRSESEGEEPSRRVVVLPAEGPVEAAEAAVMEPAGGQG